MWVSEKEGKFVLNYLIINVIQSGFHFLYVRQSIKVLMKIEYTQEWQFSFFELTSEKKRWRKNALSCNKIKN